MPFGVIRTQRAKNSLYLHDFPVVTVNRLLGALRTLDVLAIGWRQTVHRSVQAGQNLVQGLGTVWIPGVRPRKKGVDLCDSGSYVIAHHLKLRHAPDRSPRRLR